MKTLLQNGTLSEVARYIRTTYPDSGYVAYHAPRYATLLSLLSASVRSPCRVLDIGRSNLTMLISQTLDVPVDSLGFPEDRVTDTGRHYRFDLNDSQQKACWRHDLPGYDVIVMAEVIEHLPTSPAHVLAFLTSLLNPGGVLVLQTPNAAALHKRVKLLMGWNPYQRIKEDLTDPGHFREYTLRELKDYVAGVGLTLEQHLYGNYFDYRYREYAVRNDVKPRVHSGLLNGVYRFLPGPLKPGIMLLARKPDAVDGIRPR